MKLKHIKLGYHYFISYFMYFLFIPLLFISSSYLLQLTCEDLSELWNHYLNFKYRGLISFSSIPLFLALRYLIITRTRNIYLVNFTCYKPKSELACSKERFLELSTLLGTFNEDNLAFQKKIVEKSGLGPVTYLPRSLLSVPPFPCDEEAKKEVEMVMFGAIDDLLLKTGVNTKEIGILIVNCSTFTSTPSHSDIIVNRYKLRGNIVSYDLGGMGCSAGVISIDLAKHLLQTHLNTYALIVTMETITLNWYFGNDRSMLVSNCLFRVGGAAILLSNNPSDRHRSKYKLLHTVRTHKGADDRSFGCVYQHEDKEGEIGVALSKDLMDVAGQALEVNITTLGPLVLPISEKLLFLLALFMRKFLKMKKIKTYVPDFKLAFEHFCIHSGGKAVLNEVQKKLELSEWHMEPSRMTLYRFGNTSSSSMWYELAYTEAMGRVKKGDRAWQIAFGSGFKCNSAVWKAIRAVDPAEETENPWMEEINTFPAHVS